MKAIKCVLKLCLLFSLVVGGLTRAAYKDTHNVKIKLISIWTKSGGLLVQTEPRPNITGLNCTKDYWLEVAQTDLGIDATLSILLAAQTTNKLVNISAADDNGGEYCRLRRVIALP